MYLEAENVELRCWELKTPLSVTQPLRAICLVPHWIGYVLYEYAFGISKLDVDPASTCHCFLILHSSCSPPTTSLPYLGELVMLLPRVHFPLRIL